MMRALNSLLGLVCGFFRWWFSELALLIPSALRDRLSGRRERLLVEMVDGTQRLYRQRGRKAVPLGADKAPSRTARGAVILALPRTEIVTRPTQLPLAAQENLREVVGFEMDRLTPFSRDDVYYACRVTGRDAKAGQLAVDILLAPRRRIDDLLEELRAQGLRVAAVDVATETPGRPLGVNLLPETVRTAPSRLGRALAGLFTAAAATLLLLAVLIPLQRQQDYAEALDARVAAERARIAVLRHLEEEIASLKVPGTSLQAVKREEALTLALLDQVTRLLPDGTWLNQLNLNGDRLDLAGFSPNSSQLITTFEQSPRFTEATFRAPVTQDQRLGLERFSISMRIVSEGGR